jgi:hypothetical protein
MKKCVNFNGDHQCVDCFCFSQMKIRVKTQREDRTPPKFHVVNDRSDSFKWILVTQEWLWLPLLRSVFFKMFLSVSTPSMSFSFNNLLQKATCPTLSQISHLVKFPITVSLKSTPLARQCWSNSLLPSPVGRLIEAILSCCLFSYWKLVISESSSCTFALQSHPLGSSRGIMLSFTILSLLWYG